MMVWLSDQIRLYRDAGLFAQIGAVKSDPGAGAAGQKRTVLRLLYQGADR